MRTWEDRPPVEIDRGKVQSGHRHQHRRLALVAAGDADQRVEPFRVHHQLDGVGDHLPGDQRRLHTLVAHRDAVGDRDRRELEGDGAALADALLRERSQLVEVVIAGGHLVPGGRDPDLRLAEVLLGEADRPKIRSSRSPVRPLGHLPAPRSATLS
jgi:hypothetical protein